MLAALSQLPSALTPRTLELSLRAANPKLIVAGVDEAGVGTIAGPLVAAAVALPLDDGGDALELAAVDSKELSAEARRAAFEQICAAPGVAFGVAAVSARRLDALGPRPAWALAVRLACRRLERALAASARPHYLVDGDTVPAGLDGTAVPGGDRREAAIAAASVVAASAHDDAMARLARRHPLWALDENGGHPSRAHLARIAECGPSACHRASCFPFRRRQGARYAYHPDRRAAGRIQELLAAAARGDAPGSDAERERHERFREMAAKQVASAAGEGRRRRRR